MEHILIRPMMAVALLVLIGGCGRTEIAAKPEPSSSPIPAITYDALFVVNGGSNSISVINATTHEVSGTISLEHVSFPHHISLSPGRAELVVAVPGVDLSGRHDGGGHGGSGTMVGTILRLDALTGETKAARRLDGPNHNGISSPDGKEIWTSKMEVSGTVLVLDASTLATRKIIGVGEMPAEVTFSREGNYAFVANTMSNSVTVIDVATKAVAKTIAVGDGPVGAWTGSDGVMYVDNEAGKSITAIDAMSLNIIRTYDLGFMPGMAATAPNGELWVTDAEHGKVAFYSTAAETKLGELATGAGAHAIVFSDDGRTAYVSNQSAGTVSVIDIATRAVSKAITVGAKPNGMAFRTK